MVKVHNYNYNSDAVRIRKVMCSSYSNKYSTYLSIGVARVNGARGKSNFPRPPYFCGNDIPYKINEILCKFEYMLKMA